ncbi:MAG: methylated-DNA--[protein]-cysteine S-methyltransferase [Candidatus Babeliales bacterium]
MQIIPLSKAEFDKHISQSQHTYAYYRIGNAPLEVISTSRGAFQASFVSHIPHATSYSSLDELNVPLLCTGTPFQIKVWQAALAITPGTTATYHNLAHTIGHAQAYRAVGSALGKNKLAYLIPCHRVVKKDGDLGNYRWGREVKEALLGLELNS